MSAFKVMGGAALLFAVSTIAQAEELKSGIPVGGRVGSYSTVKVAGIEDGVKCGSSLCYTWRLGGRPVVFIFAKTPDDALASLVKELDKTVAKNKKKKMAAVVNFSGKKTDAYKKQIEDFAEKHNIENVALTTSSDGDRFEVNPKAGVTVMLYKGKRVKFNKAIAPGAINKKVIDEILKGTGSILE